MNHDFYDVTEDTILEGDALVRKHLRFHRRQRLNVDEIHYIGDGKCLFVEGLLVHGGMAACKRWTSCGKTSYMVSLVYYTIQDKDSVDMHHRISNRAIENRKQLILSDEITHKTIRKAKSDGTENKSPTCPRRGARSCDAKNSSPTYPGKALRRNPEEAFSGGEAKPSCDSCTVQHPG